MQDCYNYEHTHTSISSTHIDYSNESCLSNILHLRGHGADVDKPNKHVAPLSSFQVREDRLPFVWGGEAGQASPAPHAVLARRVPGDLGRLARVYVHVTRVVH